MRVESPWVPSSPCVRRPLRHALLAAPALLCLAGACTTAAPASSVSVTIAPSPDDVLTCSSVAFTAKVSGSSDVAVTFSVDPAVGSIDASGKYAAPLKTPTPATVKVTAKAHADSTKSATSTVTLATAFPGDPVSIAPMAGFATQTGAGVYVHTVAASGKRVYAAWPDGAGTATVVLKVARSDDGGATWGAPVSAISVDLSQGAGPSLECPAIAIDAGNPDVVYVVGHVAADNQYSAAINPNGDGSQTQLFAVSSDGGATFTTDVMHVGASGDVCADVISPAADKVVVLSPGSNDCGVLARDIFVWSDSARGQGFGSGELIQSPIEYFANGYTKALDDLVNDPQCTSAHLFVSEDGGTGSSGATTESPRLFVGGAGKLCVTYVGFKNTANGVVTHAYTQCSSDAGATFSPPLVVDPKATHDASSVAGALGPNHAAALLWTTGGPPNGALYVATSTDDGATYGAPATVPIYTIPGDSAPAFAFNPTLAYDANGILWISYVADDNGNGNGIVVDKSCDGGTSWSGPVLVNASSAGMRWPSLAMTDEAAPHVAVWAGDHIGVFSLAPRAQ